MNEKNEKLPNPKEIEKEISEFLGRKYGNQVKIVSPIVMPLEDRSESDAYTQRKEKEHSVLSSRGRFSSPYFYLLVSSSSIIAASVRKLSLPI